MSTLKNQSTVKSEKIYLNPLLRENSQNILMNVKTFDRQNIAKRNKRFVRKNKLNYNSGTSNIFLKLDGNDADADWINKFNGNDNLFINNKVTKKLYSGNRGVRENKIKVLKIRSSKVFLEDTNENSIIKSKNSLDGNSKVKWKQPLHSEKTISESERNRKKGFLSKVFGYFCVYIPNKCCNDTD